MKNLEFPYMDRSLRFESTTPARHSTGASPVRQSFVFILLVLSCLALTSQVQAQLPNIFAADNPSGSVNSGGANFAYLQNTSGSDVTLTLDGNTITTKANRLNIFDRSSGTWVLKAVLNQQSQPISTFATNPSNNTFLTGLYSYYKLDEPSNTVAIDALNGRNLKQGNAIVGSTAGVINTARDFPGNAYFFRESFTDFAPGANHFFATFWTKAATFNQAQDASFLGRFGAPNWEWLVWFNDPTHKIFFGVSANGTNAVTVASTTAIANTTSWYFVAVGWDGTNIKISINGQPYATTSFAGPVFNGSNKFCIGAESGSNRWTGQIDEVAVWIGRNDLTISEVQQLYNNGAGLPFSSFH
jgi:Concanavalin A-like lectin/glucanases superfamily